MASSSSISSEVTPPWLELPREMTTTILQKLGAIEILTTAEKVCTTWRSLCQEAAMWQSIDMRNEGNLWEMPYDLEKMCRHAVDRSQGQLIDINIEYFGSDELLLYISQRCPQLRRLRLVLCYGVTGEGVAEAVKNLPLLEELHLYYTYIDNEAIEAVVFQCQPWGNLGKLCFERIKDLRRPHDSTDDYGFDAEIHDYETSGDDYITGYSDIDMVSDYGDYLEFSGGSMSSVSSYEYEDELLVDWE
ncbi:UNVERIFIED_CONTAM: F-box protein SKIP19 [Sesamum calycinum]|uniref:F-box protein SKIP19 n=1 Tax=Sesamum calycinum TaxID=2727403 RepID=A0AAW2Q7X7_9LAMI